MELGKLRLDAQAFDKFMPKIRDCMGSRFTNPEQVAALTEQNKEMEAWISKKIGSGKFLTGTDTPSYLDIHCYVFVERLIMFEQTSYEGAKAMNVKENLPIICSYVENFRSYPVFKDHCITLDAFQKQNALQFANPMGVKYQLDLKSLTIDA